MEGYKGKNVKGKEVKKKDKRVKEKDPDEDVMGLFNCLFFCYFIFYYYNNNWLESKLSLACTQQQVHRMG